MNNKEMKREKLFSRNGNYDQLVESNCLLHKECIGQLSRVAKKVLEPKDSFEPVRVLDLACGGMPVSLSRGLQPFGNYRFHYIGVDINPDQVALASAFALYPDNFVSVEVVEASAWDLSGTGLSGIFDMIFMGANLHHGTPEEIYFLANQLWDLLKHDGVFISHDWYRPDHEPYQRRPDHHPGDDSESYLLVSPESLDKIKMPDFGFPEIPAGEGEPEWRKAFAATLKQTLADRLADKTCVITTFDHVRQRDFPVSLAEFRQIMEYVGFHVRICRYQESNEPLERFFAMPVASKIPLPPVCG